MPELEPELEFDPELDDVPELVPMPELLDPAPPSSVSCPMEALHPVMLARAAATTGIETNESGKRVGIMAKASLARVRS